MNRIFRVRGVVTDESSEDRPLLLYDIDPDLEGNNNEVTTSSRTDALKKIVIPVLILAFIGSIATTIGVAAAPRHDDDPILRALDPISAGKLQRIRELAPKKWRDATRDPSEICFTSACLDAALDLVTAMNTSADPCEDFFDFTCGRWVAEHELSGSQSRTGRFNALRDEVNNITQEIVTSPPNSDAPKPLNDVKTLYAQCIDLAALDQLGTAPVTDVLNSLGGWPSLKSSWEESDADLVLTLGTIRRVYLESVFLRVYVSQDLKNTTRSLIYLDQPGFFLSRAVLLDPTGYANRIEAYKTYYSQVIGALGGDATAAINDVTEVIALETKLAEAAAPDELRGIVSRIYNPRTLDKYQEELDAVASGQLNLKGILDEIFSTSGITIAEDQQIIVLELEYYTKLVAILNETPLRTLINYVHWRVASGLLPETTNEMRAIAFEFDKVNSGLQEPAKRETSCASAALSAYGMAIGVEYVAQAFDQSSKENVDVMVENLRVAFKQLVADSQWMSDDTKPNAAAKADAIKSFMAFPEWLFNKTAVESQYIGLDTGANYLDTVTKLSVWSGLQSLSGLNKATDREEWLTYPGVVNAFYSPEMNSITFPAGILQPPFYRTRGPESINYGGIGVVIGHEITHGFDDQGSQYDANGNAENWWSAADLQQFEEKAQCIVDQYGNFEPLPGKHINGDLTSGENIADNGGLREAYLAYQNWVQSENGGLPEKRLPGLEGISPDQLFFLGYASLWCERSTDEYLDWQLQNDPHSPGRYRVLGPLRNSDVFAEKWGCAAGTNMNPNPDDRCVVW